MLSKNISSAGVEVIERMLALSPELRITAGQALRSEWLRLGHEGATGPETEEVQRQRKAQKWEEAQAPGWIGADTGASDSEEDDLGAYGLRYGMAELPLPVKESDLELEDDGEGVFFMEAA